MWLSRVYYYYPVHLHTMGNVIILTENSTENAHSEKSRHSLSIHAAPYLVDF